MIEVPDNYDAYEWNESEFERQERIQERLRIEEDIEDDESFCNEVNK